MKKVLLSLFFIALTCASAWGDENEYYSYNSTTKTLTVKASAYDDGIMTDYTISTQPWKSYVYTTGLKIEVEDGITHIGAQAFNGFTKAVSVTLPATLVSIGDKAFNSCSLLTKLYFKGTPSEWASIDFQGDVPYNAHPFGEITKGAGKLYFYGKTTAKSDSLLALPPTITEVKPYAFYKANIKELSLPGTIETIGAHAFDCNIDGNLAINRIQPPTTGESAFTFATGSTRYLYIRSDANTSTTNGYRKTPWYDSSSSGNGATQIGFNDGNNTAVSYSWGKVHITSGTCGNPTSSDVHWELSEDGTLTISGSGALISFSSSTSASNLLPWYRFRRLVYKVVVEGTISALTNSLTWCYGLNEVDIQQPSVMPTASGGISFSSLFNQRDNLTLRIHGALEDNATIATSPWNNARWNTIYTEYCATPSALNISNIGTTTATASWTDNSGDTWKYICKLSSESEPTSSEWASASSTNSKSVTISGLTPASDYTFYLVSDCGTLSSDVLSADFTTECSVIASASIPWSYGFETGVTNNEIPRCWKEVKKSGSTAGSVTANSYNKRTGSYCLSIAGGNSTGYTKREIIAIFPAFEDDIKDLALSFWYKTSVTDGDYTYGQPQLGYITDPEDDDTFVAVGAALAQTADYTKVEDINMSGAPSGARFAILYTGGTDNGNVYIDDITVTEKPACNKPTGVSAGSVTDEGATITWNANDMTAWVMQVSEGDASSWGDDIAVATNSKVLTGLKAHTLYYVRVKADCDEIGDSEWSDNVSFTTLCGTVSVSASSSWNNDFESLGDHVIPECWDNSASTTTTSSWGSGYIWGTFERSSNKMLAMDNTVCDGGTALINTPDIAIPNDGREYELSFDYSNMAIAGNNLYVKISNGGAFADKGTYYPSGNVSSYPGDFVPATISLADYSGQTIKIQFFANPTDGTASSGGAMFIDNISVHKVPTCFQPTELAASNLTSISAHMTWTAGGSETAWRLQYRADGGDWSAEQSVSTNAQYDITGLSANTLYYVRVKAYCGAEDQSEWSEVASFTTLCAAASMPFSEEFSSASALPSCWEATPASGTYKWGAYENSGAYSVQLRTGSSGSAELRMPPVALSEAAILRFEWKNVSGAQVNVYISTNGGSSRTMLPNDLTSVHSDWTTKVIDLSAYTGETALIYFVANFSTANQYAYLDDVEVVARPCEMILNIAAAPITGGATLSWSGSVQKIRYKTGSAEWSYATPANNAGPHTLSGLTPARSYQFCLLPTCLAEEEANWTTPVFFTTKATEIIPYENDFEAETPGEVPFNWSRISASEYPQVSHDSYAYRDGGSFGDQGNSVKFYGVNDQIIVLPEFDQDLENLMVSFHYRNRDCTMQLGYIEEDGTTFVALETLSNQTGYGEYPFEKDLYGISSNAANLAIRYSNAGGTAQAWVDNVEVKEATCGQPTDLAFDNVTANSVHISWSASARGTESNYQYIRQVWSEDDPNWASATLIESDETELNLTGLSANTRYEFYLRSYCGVSDQSTPVKVEFRTLMKDEVFEDLASATNNETRLAALEGQTINMTIKRPLLLNGDYCTLCLPFDLSASEIADPECPLHGFVIKEFEMSKEASGAVNIYLNQVTSIEAGKPYFVRYAGELSEDRLTPMTFNGVTIQLSTPLDEELTDDCTPHGVFNPYALVANDQSTLFLSSNNTLYYPSADGTMNGFRAYIKVGGAMSAPIRRGAPIRIVEHENMATGVESIQHSDVSIQKVIRNGQLIIIRDNKEYNVMGIMMK